MEKKLTKKQLEQVVAEVTRLVEVKEQELDRYQVVEILNDLNLPAELLDDAMLQLQRREESAKVKRKKVLITVAVVAIIGLAGFAVVSGSSHQSEQLQHITVDNVRLTPATDNGGDMTSVHQSADEVYLRMKLRDVPANARVPIRTDWIAPNGQIFKQNMFHTKAADKTVWNTHSKCILGSSAPKGDWKVKIYVNGRFVTERGFVLE